MMIVLLLLVVLAPVGAASDGKTVKIGFYSLPGFQNIEEDGTLSGYMYDYLQEIAKYTDWQYEYYTYSFSGCLQKLQTGELDFMSGMQKVRDRENVYTFPQYSCGVMYIGLYVDVEDTQYAYNDTENFTDLKVGVVKGVAGNKDFEQYCTENNFTVAAVIEYDDDEQLKKAFQKGEITAICSLSTYATEELRCIAGFAYKDFYMMSGANGTALIKELNKALEQIKVQNPFYEQNLWNQYVPLVKSARPVFTNEELEYIKNSGTINAVYNKNWIPMERYDAKNDCFDGIGAEIFSLIAELSGLEFNFIPMDNYAKALEMLKTDEVNVICSTAYDYSWAALNNMKLSREYLSIPILKVSTKEKRLDRMVVAMPAGLYLTKVLKKDFPEYYYKEYVNYQECLKAILDGEADASFMNSLMASEYLKDSQYNHLVASTLYGYMYHFCVGFSSEVDNTLITIIDKTLTCITGVQITNFITDETVKYNFVSLLDLIYQNPGASILVISLFFAFLIGILLLIIFNKSRHAKELYEVLNLDHLTGGSSPFKFRADAAMLLKNTGDSEYAVLYANIVQFKAINEMYGYGVGDKVLKCVCSVLKAEVEKDELYTRIYSDRFVMLLHYTDKEYLNARYKRIESAIKYHCSNECLPRIPEFKVGVYILTANDTDINTVIDYAVYAHEQSYVKNNPNCIYYDERLKQKIHSERMLADDMEQALADGEFEAYYQPKMNSDTDIVTGAEALIRWRHKVKGLISPGEFIPLFEKNGSITKIDLFVFNDVCKLLSQRRDEGKPLFPVSCNFSRIHFLNEDFPDKLAQTADCFCVDHSLLEIELTETVAVEDLCLVKKQLDKLHSLGFQISIDDFGSGYSSLGILSEIRFDVIKIDRSLINNAVGSEYNRRILYGIVKTIQALEKKIVCEGVERRDQVDLLKSFGCFDIQGFYYPRPLPKRDFLEYVDHWLRGEDRTV
jgi:diguanylate cyclase (GGDEF)-like protein